MTADLMAGPDTSSDHDWRPARRRLTCPACGATADCPRCGGRLDWADDAWCCAGCGDEWPADAFGACPRNRHRITWYARVDPCPEVPDGWLPRTHTMRGAWAWDVRCSCGQQTNTGGATERHLRDRVHAHTHTHLGLPL